MKQHKKRQRYVSRRIAFIQQQASRHIQSHPASTLEYP